MLTIEEQIERIAHEAFERASTPRHAPRRWPAMAAAAVLLVAAGSAVWSVSRRGTDVPASEGPVSTASLAVLLDGAVEYPLTAVAAPFDRSPGAASFREPGSVRAVRTPEGTVVFRESGVTAVPGYGVFEARCAGVDGLTIGCELPNATDLPWILDPTRVGFGMWVDVPAAVDVVVLTDGANRIWQRPVNGLAVWPPTTDSGWTLEAFDTNGEPIVRIDQSTIEAQDVSSAPSDPTVGDAEIAGTLSTFRQCLVGEGATFEVEANLPQFAAGIDPSSAWDSCVSSTLDTAVPDAEEAQLPAAYAEVLALFPSNDWIALAVQPGENPSAFAYDRSGRSFGFSYVESMAQQGLPDTTDAPIISLPDGLNLYASYDSAVITTSA